MEDDPNEPELTAALTDSMFNQFLDHVISEGLTNNIDSVSLAATMSSQAERWGLRVEDSHTWRTILATLFAFKDAELAPQTEQMVLNMVAAATQNYLDARALDS